MKAIVPIPHSRYQLGCCHLLIDSVSCRSERIGPDDFGLPVSTSEINTSYTSSLHVDYIVMNLHCYMQARPLFA